MFNSYFIEMILCVETIAASRRMNRCKMQKRAIVIHSDSLIYGALFVDTVKYVLCICRPLLFMYYYSLLI